MVTNKPNTIVISLGLILLSLLLSILRSAVFSDESYLRNSKQIVVQIAIPAGSYESPVELSVPWNTEWLKVNSESIRAPHGRIIRTTREGDTRKVRLDRYVPNHTIDAVFGVSEVLEFPKNPRSSKLGEIQRRKWTQVEDDALSESFKEDIQNLIGEEEGIRLQAVFHLMSLHEIREPEADRYSPQRFVQAARLAALPSRIVTGINIEDEGQVTQLQWAEVFLDSRWQAVKLYRQPKLGIPKSWIPMAKNRELIVDHKGINAEVRFQVNPVTVVNADTAVKELNAIIDLKRLDADLQYSLGLLLLLPFGVLLTALIRTVVGIQAFGVFSAPLLALAMVYTDLLSASIVFAVVVFFGVIAQSFFSKSRYARFVRLSIIFTIVSLLMTYTISFLEFSKMAAVTDAILLPIVILTTLVDRVYSAIERDGTWFALKKLFWTVILAFLCVFIFVQDKLMTLAVAYPEIHFSTIGVILMLIKYKKKTLIQIFAQKRLVD